MKVLKQSELNQLIESTGDHLVSIYMPTHVTGAEIQQDSIRLKNLLRKAETLLVENGASRPDARDILSPAEALLQQGDFWQHQGSGLALFLSSEEDHEYRLSFRTEEVMVVGKRFHLTPLFRMLSRDERFYVLALSKNQIRFFKADQERANEIDLEDVPQSFDEALGYDNLQKSLQWHTGSSPGVGSGERPAMYHGHGSGEEDEKAFMLQYFERVDDGLKRWLAGDRAPLVLAGVEYLHPIYKDATDYQYVTDNGIYGNPEDLSADELYHRAWEIVEPRFRLYRKETVDRFNMLAGQQSPLATDDIGEIVQAAYGKRVEVLFVSVDEQIWGKYNQNTNEVDVHSERKKDDEDLLNFAATHTFLNGGTIYVMDLNEMPAARHAAAILRY